MYNGEQLYNAHRDAIPCEQLNEGKNWEAFLKNYNIEILDRARDTLGTCLLENQLPERNRPEINTQESDEYAL